MSASPEGQVRSFLRKVQARTLLVRLAEQGLLLVAAGMVLMALAQVARKLGLLVGDAAVAWVVWLFVMGGVGALWAGAVAASRGDLLRIARRVEARLPELEGRLAGAAWLCSSSGAAAPAYVVRRAVRDAAGALARVRGAPRPAAARAGRHLLLALGALGGLALAHSSGPARFAGAAERLRAVGPPEGETRSVPRLAGAEITYHFPRYTGLGSVVATGPGDLRAPAGTRAAVRFRVRGEASRVRAVTADGISLVASLAAAGVAVEVGVPVEADGGYRVSLEAPSGEEGDPHFFLVRAVRDQAPRAHLTEPGRDLEMARPAGVLEVKGRAEDDLGLSDVVLRFLATTGSGETYRFREGTVPLLAPAEKGRRAVEVRGSLELEGLLGPDPSQGGVVSYHLEATDANDRTGPSTGLSETFLIRFPGDEPGVGAVTGILPLMPQGPLSQRQILEETLELHSRREALPPSRFLRGARRLARDERALRESFVFLVESGGSAALTEDPDAELPGASASPIIGAHDHSSEPLPYPPPVLRALRQAIGAMFRAEAALQLGETDVAIAEMEEAIGFLHEARRFDRLLLRALPTSVALDPGARGTGDLEGVEEPQAPDRGRRGPGDLALLLREIRAALQDGTPLRRERLRSWAHRAFAVPGGAEAASVLAGAGVEGVDRVDSRVRRAAGLLASLLSVSDVSPTPAPIQPGELAERYFRSLAGRAPGEAP